MDWIFSGIGTTLVIFLLGLGTNKAIKRSKAKQVQKAGDHASQIQSGRDTNIGSK